MLIFMFFWDSYSKGEIDFLLVLLSSFVLIYLFLIENFLNRVISLLFTDNFHIFYWD